MKATLLLLLLVGCKADASGGSVDGAKIFETMCTSCHGPNGKPTEAMDARMNVRDLTAPEFRARVTKDLVANQVRHGSANKLMPALETALKPEQIEAVAAYVSSPEFVKKP